MGIFSSIGKFFKKIFDFIKKILSKIAEALGPLLPLLIIAAFVFAPMIGPYLTELGLTTLGSAFTAVGSTIGAFGEYALLAVGTGVAFIVAPEESAKLVESIGSAIGNITKAAASVVGSTVGSIFSSLGTTFWLILGVGAYFVLRDPAAQVTVKEVSNG